MEQKDIIWIHEPISDLLKGICGDTGCTGNGTRCDQFKKDQLCPPFKIVCTGFLG